MKNSYLSPTASKLFWSMLLLILSICFSAHSITAANTSSSELLEIMQHHLNRNFNNLQSSSDYPMYFLAYQVSEIESISLGASLGAINYQDNTHRRYLDVDVRIGSMKLDNTHQLRDSRSYSSSRRRRVSLPLSDSEAAFGVRLWYETEKRIQDAQERYKKVINESTVKVEEEDTSDDFSPAPAVNSIVDKADISLDSELWKNRLRQASEVFKDYPDIYSSGITLSMSGVNRYITNSEGAKICSGSRFASVDIYCSTTAEDGMDLYRYFAFHAENEKGLPTLEQIEVEARRLAAELISLRTAPLVEPYSGPAILRNRASGVFFHEIFGHRIEGHRQKLEREGQTFTKKVNQQILPDFISVHDNPTLKYFNDKYLNGYYDYDDEGTRAENVIVVENGILKNFLMGRSPIKGFPKSNGHARRENSHDIVVRQGNLIIKSEKTVSPEQLKTMLIEEIKRQEKPYGLIFEDISGGFTTTGRSGPQTFKVIPLLVYKVYPDGRPDEIVRGVDIVGTPLSSFEKILMAADDPGIFNGMCGAESGSVPVSAISPSLLLQEIEVEKRMKSPDKPPILDSPLKKEEVLP